MAGRGSDFHKRLLATFRIEAEERVGAVASGLIELEQTAGTDGQAAVVEKIFREVHSLKGAARAVNLGDVETVCQSLEDIFATLKRREIAPNLAMLDVLHQAVDVLKGLLAASETERTEDDRSRQTLLVRQLKEIARGHFSVVSPATPDTPSAASAPSSPVVPTTPVATAPPMPDAAPAQGRRPEPWREAASGPPQSMSAETVRISAARLESLLLEAEELLSAKLAGTQRIAELRELHVLLTPWHKQWGKLQGLHRKLSQKLADRGQNGQAEIDPQLATLHEFLEWNRTWVELLEGRLGAVLHAAEKDQRALGGMVDYLLQDVKQVLMLPFSSLLETFPSLTRDLARRQDKEAQLVLHGAEIEVDRRILQEIKDPLIHLVRNCIDHGIELPDVRVQQQKPPRGTVTITVVQRDSSKIDVLIADDGAGIDTEKVRGVAVRLGLLAPEATAKLGDSELQLLVFQSGLSTSPLITDISGRGLGLAIVQEKVEKLGGTVSLETETNVGTTFHLVLPLTLATLRGLVVRAEGQCLIVPVTYIDTVAGIDKSTIRTVENRETILVGGQALSLVSLGQVLGLPRQSVADAAEPTKKITVVVLGAAEKRIAFQVDEILGEQEVLMKSLGPQLARVRNIASATVLGTGQVAPILNVPDLMKSAIRVAEAPAADVVEAAAPQAKSVLVVEDSITARTQLKNILELSGYLVRTAVDGLDALLALRTETFDLVVSDVDMPRLNGFDLTARIRSDKKLADLPVVLVTALASRQDQTRGIEVGANAYIIKSNFDQNNLLDVIRRLI